MTQHAAGTELRDVRQRLRKEVLVAGRFGLVGITATTVHMLIVCSLIATTDLPVLVANLIAFLTAFSVSFTGNYVWTFGAPGSAKTAMRRYILISSGAFSANTAILMFLTKCECIEPVVAATCSAAAIPLLTYLASRFWGFRVGLRSA